MLDTCPMCGKELFLATTRLYKYDNGEQFRETVCLQCAKAHDRLVGK